MVKITKEQIDSFSNWKYNLASKVDVMLDTVKISKPEDYENDSFYKELSIVRMNIDNLRINHDATQIYYFTPIGKQTISKETTFGFYLCKYCTDITYMLYMSEYKNLEHVVEMFENAGRDLADIFEVKWW